MKCIRWSIKEDKILKKHYDDILHGRYNKLKRTRQAIYRRASFLGVKANMRLVNKRYSHNVRFFRKPNLLNSYWAGFIAADGHIRNKTKAIAIALKASDGLILQRLRKDINFNGSVLNYKIKLTHRKNKSYKISNLTLYSAHELVKDLSVVFGIRSPKRKANIKLPVASKEAIAFAVGYIDGDGCIFLKKNRKKQYRYLGLSIAGTKGTLNWLKIVFEKQFKVEGINILKGESKNYKILLAQCSKAAKILLPLMSLRLKKLDRKWDRVKKWGRLNCRL